MAPWTLYGQKGTGAVAIEAALTLLRIPYVVEEFSLVDTAGRTAFERVNPMSQFPALILPSGELMTESAAILIWLADSHAAYGLSPAIDAPERTAFLRWMAFVSSAIYALYWIQDEPLRLADSPDARALVKVRTAERIAACWGIMESGIEPGPYLLGENLTVLDLYVTVVSRWGPREALHERIAPRIGEVVRRVESDPRLAALWAERFPLRAGD